jgi:hypothetical protein
MVYFLIDENGNVYNTILWDGDTVNNPYTVPKGHQLIPSNVGGIGWKYQDGQFIAPVVDQPSA